MSVLDISVTFLSSHPHPTKYKEIPQVLPQFTGLLVHLSFSLATAPQVVTMIVKEVKLMALTRGIRLYQYLDDVVDLTESLEWINQEKSELQPTQVFSFVGYKYQLHSAFLKLTQERWVNLQDLILC